MNKANGWHREAGEKLQWQLGNDRAKLSDNVSMFVAVLCFVNTCMTHVRQPKSQQPDGTVPVFHKEEKVKKIKDAKGK